MKLHRRQFLGAAASGGLLGSAGLLSTLAGTGHAADTDYKALVVLFLNGGNDGHNLLVPTDAGYNDYQRSRANLALSKASLATLPGTAGGRSFGLHPSLAPLVPLYQQKRLAFIANVGPLVEPATAQQVLRNEVDLPPFLFSHSDQVAIQQGWTVNDDMSSTSTSTGQAPVSRTALAVAMNVMSGTSTSSPGPMPRPTSAAKRAAVPLVTQTTCWQPSCWASSASNRSVTAPSFR